MNTIHLTNKDNLQTILDQLDKTPTTIFLKDGIYRQNIVITNDNLTFIGESHKTIIISNKHARQVNYDLTPNVTFRTETVRVTGSNIKFENLTIQNDSGLGPGVGQGVALSIYGNNVSLNNCHILGTHDTIFLGPLPLDLMERYKNMIVFDFKHYDNPVHFFNNCRIDGTVDFIFGSGTSIFYNCEINALSKGYLLAPSTYINNQIGLVLYNCVVNNLSNDPVYLARPWREHGYSAFINTTFNGIFEDKRFHQWEKNNYRLYELPYVESSLGKPLPEHDLVKIDEIIKSYI